jgi:serine/threonine protein kinase
MMKFKRYLRKTFRKGNLLVKGIKVFRFLKHSLYAQVKVRVGHYKTPPENIQFVGFFDKNRLVHTEEQFRHYFNKKHLYDDGKYREMKREIISIVKFNDHILVKKKFSGIQRYNHFYNELICLFKCQKINEIPSIRFVDYDSCTLYMDYIEGMTIRTEGTQKLNFTKSEYQNMLMDFAKILNQIHSVGVMMYDLKGTNMMKSDESCYFIDFADAVYFGNMFRLFILYLLNNEKIRLNEELLTCIEDAPEE